VLFQKVLAERELFGIEFLLEINSNLLHHQADQIRATHGLRAVIFHGPAVFESRARIRGSSENVQIEVVYVADVQVQQHSGLRACSLTRRGRLVVSASHQHLSRAPYEQQRRQPRISCTKFAGRGIA
jgi:hypothetical protein